MSAEKKKKEKIIKKLPNFSAEQNRVAKNLLVLELPYDYVVQALLDKFSHILENCEVSDELTEERKKQITDADIESAVRDVIHYRIKKMKTDGRRSSCEEIKRKKEERAEIVADTPIMDPLFLLKEMEIRRQKDGLTFDQLLKLYKVATKDDGNTNADLFSMLPGRSEVTQTEPKQKGNAFGGAMMNHANTEQETSEDS